MLRGPLFVGEDYRIDPKVVAMSGSKRTGSLWVRTEVFNSSNALVATMLLDLATLAESYASYDRKFAALPRSRA